MTWDEFFSLVAVAVTAGVVTAYLTKVWGLTYRERLTVMRRMK